MSDSLDIGDYEFENKYGMKYNVISHMCSTGMCPHCGHIKTKSICNDTRCENCNKVVPYLLSSNRAF